MLGSIAASTVTAIPTAIGTSNACLVTWKLNADRSSPKKATVDDSALTTPTAATIPTSEPAAPTNTASTSTEREICPEEIPMLLNRANSRRLCRSTIVKVLEIITAPTNSAIKPNAANRYVMNSSWVACSLPILSAICSCDNGVNRGYCKPNRLRNSMGLTPWALSATCGAYKPSVNSSR